MKTGFSTEEDKTLAELVRFIHVYLTWETLHTKIK
jgi:hypothetical protein